MWVEREEVSAPESGTQEIHLAYSRRRYMKLVTKLVAASILALSAVAPAIAAEENTLLERNAYVFTLDARPIAQQQQNADVRTHRGIDALAFAPVGAAPREVRDFGIGSES